MRRARTTIGWYGSSNVRTAVSPERGDVGERTNHRRRLFSRWYGIEPRGRHFYTHDGTRGHGSRQNYGEHYFPAAGPQTQRRGERYRRKQTVRPWWGRRRTATAMERGGNGSLFFSSRERWVWGARCLCFVLFSCLLCYLFIPTFR